MKWIKRIFGVVAVLVIAYIGIQYVGFRDAINNLKSNLPGESQLVETRVGPVEYQVQGNTDQYVLLIHGTPGSYRTFMADALTDQGFTVISPSRPGYFRTPLESGPSVEEQADLYAALLDQLSIDSAAIIGFSGGGPSAIEFAIRHPNRCAGLVIMASAGRSFEPPEAPWLQQVVMSSDFGKWKAFEALTGKFNHEDTGKIALEYVRTTVFPVEQTETGEQNDFKQFASAGSFDLTKISCPTLIIHGTEDELIPFAEATYLNEQIPQSKLIAKEGQDHFTVVFFEFRQNLESAGQFLLTHS